MNKKKIHDLVVKSFEFIQELSGQEKVDINGDTVPIGQIPGFDSLNDVEFTTKISEYIPLEKSIRLCVSDDGKKALSVRQIVERLIKLCKATRGGK
jgi:hypothetical protein